MDAPDFAKQYEEFTDEQLSAMKTTDLVPQARIAYEAELSRRATPEYREKERLRVEETEKVTRTRSQKMEFFSKERTIHWKLAMCFGLFVVVLVVMILLSQVLRFTSPGISHAEAQQMGGRIAQVVSPLVGIGWAIILSRPRKRGK